MKSGNTYYNLRTAMVKTANVKIHLKCAELWILVCDSQLLFISQQFCYIHQDICSSFQNTWSKALLEIELVAYVYTEEKNPKNWRIS